MIDPDSPEALRKRIAEAESDLRRLRANSIHVEERMEYSRLKSIIRCAEDRLNLQALLKRNKPKVIDLFEV